MKFIKTDLPTGKAFISKCGNYKVVNYGGKIYSYYKTANSFGNSLYHTPRGNSFAAKTYREAFRLVDKYINEKRVAR